MGPLHTYLVLAAFRGTVIVEASPLQMFSKYRTALPAVMSDCRSSVLCFCQRIVLVISMCLLIRKQNFQPDYLCRSLLCILNRKVWTTTKQLYCRFRLFGHQRVWEKKYTSNARLSPSKMEAIAV